MDNNNPQPIELDIKDIFLFILKKAHIVLLGGVIIAVLAGGYVYFESLKASAGEAPKTNVLDLDVRLSGESDEEYEQRVLLVGRAESIKANIEVLNSQNSDLRNYISDSLLMQLDPMNVSVSEVQFLIKLDESESYAMIDALVNSYTNVVESGDYISDIAQEYDYVPGSLQELINAGYAAYNTDIIIDSGDINSIVFTIKIWGDSPELTNTILDGTLLEISEKHSEFNTSIAKHTITEIGRQNYVAFVSDVRDLQLKTMTTYQTLQSQIDSGNKSLDDIAKQLGLTDRNDFYTSVSKSTSAPAPKSSAVKTIGMGFVLGVVVVMAIYVCKYIFGRKIYSQAEFFCLYPDCVNVGVLKPTGKRNKLISAIDRASGDDAGVSDDSINGLVAANLKNLTKGMDKVLLTGTVDNETAKKIAEEMALACDVRMNIFDNPEVLGAVSEYDGVVILEQRGVSEKKRVRKEYELLRNGAKKIIGAIIF